MWLWGVFAPPGGEVQVGPQVYPQWALEGSDGTNLQGSQGPASGGHLSTVEEPGVLSFADIAKG